MLKKIFLYNITVVNLVFMCALPVRGQGGFTTVTGTVKDPAGITWACGTISAQLITAGGAAPTLNGGGFTTQTSPVQLGCPTIPGSGASGSFVMRLADSGVISPGNTTWKFTVGTTGTPPPLGTGPQSFSYTTAINCSTNTPTTCTSNQLDISTPISALAPAIGAGGIPSTQVNVPCVASPTFTIGSTFITDFFMNLNCNVTSSTMAGTLVAGVEATFTLTQDATGGRTFTWPAGFLNTPTLNTLAGSTTVATFQYCGAVGSGNACPANSWQNTDVGPTGAVVGPVINVTNYGAAPTLPDNATAFAAVATAANTAAYTSVGTPTIRSTVATVMSSGTISSATATVNISAGDTVLIGTIALNGAAVLTYTVSDGVNTYYPVNLNSSPVGTFNEQVQVFGTVPGAAKAFAGTLTVTISAGGPAQFGFIVLDAFNVGSYGQGNLFNSASANNTPTVTEVIQDNNNIIATWIDYCNAAGVTISQNTGTLQQSWNSTATICGAGLVTNTSSTLNTSLTTSASLSAGSVWAVNGLELRSVTTQIPTVYFPTGRYTYTSGLNFTNPVTLRGEPGAVLCYGGIAHAIDLGPTTLTFNTLQNDLYTVDGLRFECGGGETQGIVFNNNVVLGEVKNNVFYNFGNTSSSAIFSNGNTEDLTVRLNRFQIWDGAPPPTNVPSRSFVNVTTNSQFSTLIMTNNSAVCVASKRNPGVGCGATSGPLVTSQGYANIISDNNVNGGFCPTFALIGGGTAAASTRIQNNNIETDQSNCYGITFQSQLDGLKVLNNFWSNKCASPTTCSLLGPASVGQVLANAEVSNNILVNNPTNNPVVALSNVTGQTNNIGWHNICSTGQYSGTTPCPLLHTTGTNISPWIDVLSSDFTQGVGFGTTLGNTTAVTATNPSAATILQELALPAGVLNLLNESFNVHANGLFTTAAAQTPTLTFVLQLCTAVGGTGTCVAQATWVTNASTGSTTNNNWAIDAPLTTVSIGAAGTLMVGGYVTADLGATTLLPDTIQGNSNIAASAATNLTVPLFLSLTVQMSSANAGNSVKQLQMFVK
jgi:hypothetical protein